MLGCYKLVSEPWFEQNKVHEGKYLNSTLCALVISDLYNPRLDQDRKVKFNTSKYV
ncbi:hypothetical protein Hanom_Chr03g00212921 [Helianthus anomalus]